MKFVDTKVVFRELPNEITLAINISGCPCACHGCHSSYLAQDIGTPLSWGVLSNLIQQNIGITAISLMGGDADPSTINQLARYVKSYFNIKVGWYSGRQALSDKIDLQYFDYIKLGPWLENRGPLNNRNTNQRLYSVEHLADRSMLHDITSMFWI